jgi:pilus assembly protein Flp/PilA
MIRTFGRLMRDENGATAIEYSLIASLIAIVIIASVSALGNSLSQTYNYVKSNVKST